MKEDKQLNDAYRRYVTTGDEMVFKLMRSIAVQYTGDEDVAQDVLTIIIAKLPSFNPMDSKAFAKWYGAILRNHRLSLYEYQQKARKRSGDYDDISHTGDVSFADISRLPSKIQVIADGLLRGETMLEIATRTNIKVTTLRKRLRYYKSIGSPLAG